MSRTERNVSQVTKEPRRANSSLHHPRASARRPTKVLILATPAGLDRFFHEAGRVATDTSPESGAVTPAGTARLLAVAPKHGIDVKLPPL